MYVRFIVLTPNRRPAPGLFRSDFDPHEDLALPEWIRDVARHHYEWFGDNLPVPRRLTVVSRRRHIYVGICWFRPTAHEHIARARDLALLMEEAGYPTRMVATRHPGQILYRDELQIVAKPELRTRLT